jgi:hypothetical protein
MITLLSILDRHLDLRSRSSLGLGWRAYRRHTRALPSRFRSCESSQEQLVQILALHSRIVVLDSRRALREDVFAGNRHRVSSD